MSNSISLVGHRSRANAALAVVVLAVFAALALAPRASALPDPIAPGADSTSTFQLGGNFAKRLQKAKITVKAINPGKKFGAKIKFPVREGTVDPTTVSGLSETNGGALKLQSGKKSLVLRFISIAVSGTTGTVTAKVGGKVLKIGTISAGGSVPVRTNFNTAFTGITAKATGALKTKIKKTFGTTITGNVTLAQISTSVAPSTVELVSGSTTLAPPPATLGKFQQDQISPTPIAPATVGANGPLPFFTFPVASGTVATKTVSPGRIVHTGGIMLSQANGPMGNPVAVPLTAFVVKLDPAAGNTLAATTPIGDAILGDVDISTATVGIDPATRVFTVTGASVKLNAIAAQVLNTTFKTNPAPFVAGDVLGASNLTAAAR